MNPEWWGYHALFDCKGCDPAKLQRKQNIRDFLHTLILRIDMIAVGPPLIEYLCVGDPKEGYSFVQLISTSNITGHLMNTGEAYIDVFSCKPFDANEAEACIQEFFAPTKVRRNFLIRDAG